jgi:hypothetical protein
LADSFGGVNVGTIYAVLETKGGEKVKVDLQTFKGYLKDSEKQTKTSTDSMKQAWGSMVQAIGSVVSIAVIMREAWAGMNEAMENDLALERARVVMDGLGQATDANIGKVQDFVDAWRMGAGIHDREIIPVYQRFLGLIRDTDAALQLTNISLRVQQKYGGELAEGLMRAIGVGELGRLPRMMASMGIDATGIKTLAEAVERIAKASEDMGNIQTQNAVKMAIVREQWRMFTEETTRTYIPTIITGMQGLVIWADKIVTAYRAMVNIVQQVAALGNQKRTAELMNELAKMYEDMDRRAAAVRSAPGALPETGNLDDLLAEIARLEALAAAAKAKPEKGKTPYGLWGADQITKAGEAEHAAEVWKQIDDAWLKRNELKIDSAKQLAGIMASFATDLPQGIDTAWRNLSANMLSMLQGIIQKLLETWLTAKLLDAFGLGTMPSGAKTPGTEFNWSNIGSIRGTRAVPGGSAFSLSLTGTNEGILMQAWRGANQIARRTFSEAALVTGGQQLALRG